MKTYNKAGKKCKGINPKTKGLGCGNLTKYRQYGLCDTCRNDWMLNDERGKIYLSKISLNAKNKVKKETDTNNRKQKTKSKLELLSTDGYRSKYLQPSINKIARLIDYGNPCIATGNYGKLSGGHYLAVGSNRTTALNLHNIFVQSFQSNSYKGGDVLKYQDGLKKTFGNDYFDFVNSLRQHRKVNLTKSEMIEIRVKCLEIIKRFKDDETIRTSIERIELRNDINIKLGIYDNEFCVFNNDKSN